MVALLLLCSAVLGAKAAESSGDAGSVELTVRERLGVDRYGEPVTMGVPFPKGALADVDHLRLVTGGNEVPAQFRVLGTWLPGASIRWVLVDFLTDLRANEERSYRLEYGPKVRRLAEVQRAVRIRQNEDAFVVDTGSATFRISRSRFSLFDEVILANREVLVERPSEGPRYGAEITGMRGFVTRPVPGRENRGRSHFIYAKASGAKEVRDYTLTFTSDTAYQVENSAGGDAERGKMGADFTSADGQLRIPKDAWLPYSFAKAGDVYTFRSLPPGSHLASEGVFESEVIESGPMRVVVRVKGCFGPASAPALEFTAWYHFYAGSSRVKLAFTLENNGHGGRTSTGNAHNANIGGTNCAFFDGMALRLPLALEPRPTACLLGDLGSEVVTEQIDARAQLYQDSGGGHAWDAYRSAEFQPRPTSYVSFKGYQITAGEERRAEGDRAVGWLDLSDRSGGLSVTVRDFWQNCPKALAAEQGGVVEVALFPARYAGDFPFRSGEHKTHEILFQFHGGDDGDRLQAAARGFSDPLRLEATPAWYASTGVLGELHPYDPDAYPYYEAFNLSTIGLTLSGGRSKASLIKQQERHNFFSWMDYGDVPLDFESGRGQWGLKYDFEYHMAQQYVRTQQPGWWQLFSAAARHIADIDIHHQPHYPGLHFVKGGTWAHSLHGDPGDKNPHRNRNHFTKDLSFGARGTATYHYLTGDWKARSACLELAENALAEYMSPQKDPGPPAKNNRMGTRGDACTLQRLLEGYLVSGDRRYLDRARWQIRSRAFDGRPAKHGDVKLWSSTFYAMALARYLEFFPGEEDVQGYLIAHLSALKSGIGEEGIFYGAKLSTDGVLTKGNGSSGMYNVMAADAFAIGYRYTGDEAFLDAARTCFQVGIRAAAWKVDPPVYNQVHNANGGAHGAIFMAVDAQARSEGK